MIESSASRPFRVLIVDDSVYRRQALLAMLESIPGVDVIGIAENGREALHKCIQLEPDFVTLDIHMPEMDGFTFLRILMHRRPIPVLVISGFASHENVFRALELGAVDFIAAPSGSLAPDLRHIEGELKAKVEAARRVQSKGLRPSAGAKLRGRDRWISCEGEGDGPAPRLLVAIASSTGGPVALMQILRDLPAELRVSLVIAQHMPAQFTRSFAKRLNRISKYRVVEGAHGQALRSGSVYLAPGDAHMSVIQDKNRTLRLRLSPGNDAGIFANHVRPNADHLFQSCAKVFQKRCCAVVLTGMGRDGTKGCAAIKEHGGMVYCQKPAEAAVPGMPQSVVDAGLADDAVAIARLGERIEAFVRRRGDFLPLKVA